MIGPATPIGSLITYALPLLIVYLVFAGNSLRWVSAILGSWPLQMLGLCSYSLYLWQQLFLAHPQRYLDGPFPIILLPVAVVLSVWLVEKPFIRLGRRWSHALESKQNSPSVAG